MQTIRIDGKLPGFIDYVRAVKTSPQAEEKLASKASEIITWQLGRLFKIKTPCFIQFQWIEKTTRRNKESVAFAKKYIIDALQKSEKLSGGTNSLTGFSDTFTYDTRRYGVKLTIWEAGDKNV